MSGVKIYQFNGRETYVETDIANHSRNPESSARIMRVTCYAVLQRYAKEDGISDWIGIVTDVTEGEMVRMDMKMAVPA
jgi:hypothetical protein